jgi:hypothetical protein
MSERNPAETILLLSTAYWASRCLHVVAAFGIADALAEKAGFKMLRATPLAGLSGLVEAVVA